MKPILFLFCLVTQLNAYADVINLQRGRPILLNTVFSNHLAFVAHYPGMGGDHTDECLFLRPSATHGYSAKKLITALKASEGWGRDFPLKYYQIANQVIVFDFSNHTYVTPIKLDTKNPGVTIADVIQSASHFPELGVKVYLSRDFCPQSFQSNL